MEEKSEIRVKFEIGEIKFEAEGSADLVERERSIFNNTLFLRFHSVSHDTGRIPNQTSPE